MYPTLLDMGNGVGIHSWGVMVMLAFVAGCMVLSMRARKVGIEPDKLIPFYMVITFGGLLGSRLLHFTMAEPDVFFSNPLVFFNPGRGGFAFYGGAIFSTLAGAAYAKWAKIHVLKLADVAAPSIMLGLFLGRLGCFLAGCCHGRACDVAATGSLFGMRGGDIVATDGFPWIALQFHRGVGVGDTFDVPTFPTQLWEASAALLLFLALSAMWKHARKFDGQILASLLLTYPLIRSTIEGYRGDAIRGTDYFGVLSTSQLVSIPVFLIGVGIILWRAPKGLDPEEEIVYDDEGEIEEDDDEESEEIERSAK